jgi:hypothetical protein
MYHGRLHMIPCDERTKQIIPGPEDALYTYYRKKIEAHHHMMICFISFYIYTRATTPPHSVVVDWATCSRK